MESGQGGELRAKVTQRRIESKRKEDSAMVFSGNWCTGLWVGDFFFKDFYSLILGRGERRDKERERNIDVREKHESVASHMCPDQVLGMCPDRESDVWSLCVVGRCLTNWATLVRASWRFLKLFLSHPLLGVCVFLLRSVCFDTEKSWRLMQGWLTFKGVATKFSQEEGIPEPSSEGLVQAHDVGELWGPALPGIFNWFIPMKYL